MLKRVCSFILSIVMVFTILPTQAFASDVSTEETAVTAVTELAVETTVVPEVPETTAAPVTEPAETEAPETTAPVETTAAETETTEVTETEETAPQETVEKLEASAEAANGYSGTSGSIRWEIDDAGCLTVTGTGAITATHWSSYREQITKIVIGEGITEIDDYVFQNCSSVTELSLSNTVTRLGYDAFNSCSSLRNVVLPDSVTYLDNDVFEECTSLESVVMGSGIEWVDSWIFQGCDNLRWIEFTGSAPDFASNAFYNITATVYYPGSDGSWTSDVRQDYSGYDITWVPRYYENPVSISLLSAPNQLMYQIGDTDLDLDGLKLQARDADGHTWIITDLEEITFSGFSTTRKGSKTVTVNYEGFSVQFDIYVHASAALELQPSAGYPASSHNYANNMDRRWEYTVPGAEYLELTFSSNTETESGCDYIYLYDGDGNELGVYDGTFLAGQTIRLSGDTVTIRMTTDGSVTRYGFSLDSVYAMVVEHEYSSRGVYTAPTCYEDGYYAYNCTICGTGFRQYEEGTAGHQYANGSCTKCGVPENALDYGTSGSIQWVLDEDYCLIIMGSGTVPVDGPWSGYKYSIRQLVIRDGITAIESNAFNDYDGLTAVTIADSVRTLGEATFYECSSLQSIVLPAYITSIPYDTFSECVNLSSVNIPENVTTLGEWVFNNCALTSVVIPASVETIEYNAFNNCASLTSITFQGDAPSIGEAFGSVTANAYYPAGNFTWTEDVRQDYGGSITWIGRYEPVSVELQKAPNRILYQRGDTQFDLTGLELLAMDAAGNTWVVTDTDGVTVADYDTASLGWHTVTVSYEGFTAQFDIAVHERVARTLQSSSGYPESVHNYGNNIDQRWEYSVSGAASLELTFSSNTETESGYDYIYLYDGNGNEIGEYDGTSLAGQTIKLSGDTVTIRLTTDGSETRYGFSLDSVYAMVVEHEYSSRGVYTAPTCYKDGYYTYSCTICGTGVRQYEEGTGGHRFENGYCTVCEYPETVVDSGVLDSGVTWMLDGRGRLTFEGEGAIYYGSGTWSDYSGTVKSIVILDGITYLEYDLFWGFSELRKVSIAESVTEISTSVFRECPKLTTINLPSGLRYIGDSTFLGCSSLESITIPDGVERIEFSAFENCTSLKSITIPASVTEIGDSVFANCEALEKVYFQGSVPGYISDSAFSNVTATVKYPARDDSWNEDTMRNYGGNLTWVNFRANGQCGTNQSWVLTDEGELTVSGSGKMTDYSAANTPWKDHLEFVTSVVIEDGITQIGEYAFSGCSNLRSITIPGSVTKIGEGTFYGCSSLTGIAIPEGITSIEASTFYDCSSLTNIVIPEGITRIGNDAFHGCRGLTTMTVPEKVTYIGNDAFDGCGNLKQIIFLGNAPSFGNNAFYGAGAVVYYPSTNSSWTKSVRKAYAGDITWEAYTPAVQIITEDGENVVGSTLWIDLNSRVQSATFSAYTTPEMASDGYVWEYNTNLATVRERDDGTVTVTAKGIPGEMVLTARMTASSARSSVTIKFVALSVDSEEIEGEDPADMNLFAGKSKNLKVYDQNTGKALTAKQIKWSLPGEYAPYATLTAAGKLTAKKVVEKVRIEAVGTIIGSENTTVTVEVDIFPAVTQVEVLENGKVVNGQTLTMDVDEAKRTFTVQAYPLDTAQDVTWTISDAKKQAFADYTIDGKTLTVTNPTGKAGTVTIKAAVDVGTKKTVSFKLNFGNFAESVVITNKEKTVTSGKSLTLNALVTPSNVTKSGVTWSLKNAADKAYATISAKGVLKAKTVYDDMPVTVVATTKDGLKRDEYTVTIVPKNPDMLAIFNWLGGQNVTKGTFLVNLNEEYPEAHLIGGYLSEEFYTDVEWSYKQSNVADIYEDGGHLVVAMKKAGSVTITAKAGGQTATTTIKAVALTSSVTIREPEDGLEVASGKAITLKAICEDAASSKVTWSIVEGSQYAKIASSGKLTANKDITSAKEVIVRATAADGSGVYEEATVTIRPLAQGVQIYSQQGGRTLFSVRTGDSWWVRSNTTLEWAMNEEETLQLSSHVYPYYGDEDAKNAVQGVTWKSSSNKIATADEDGLVTCIKPGTVTITATAKDGSGKSVAFKLKVVKKIESLSMEDQTVKGGKELNLAKFIQFNPTDATNKTLTWVLTGGEGAAYASINTKGVLKTKKVKEAVTVEITATAQDGSGQSVTFTVTINPA